MSDKPHVLIVDDEPLVLASISDLLEFDYLVHQADNPLDALKIIANKEYPIKVIMSDQRMPGMYGHELLREAKRLRPNTIRLLLTGYSDLESIMYSVNVGEIFRYINKPWKTETLLNVFKLAVKLHDQMTALDSPRPSNIETATLPPEQQEKKKDAQENTRPVILFIGYSEDIFYHYYNRLKHKFEILNVHTTQEAINDLKQKPISVIVSEINLGITSTLDFLIKIKQDFPNVVTIMLTKSIDANFAIRAINDLNVFRYLTPPVDDGEFELLIDEAVRRSHEYKENLKLDLFKSKTKEALKTQARQSPKADLRSNLKAAQSLLAKKRGQ